MAIGIASSIGAGLDMRNVVSVTNQNKPSICEIFSSRPHCSCLRIPNPGMPVVFYQHGYESSSADLVLGPSETTLGRRFFLKVI